MEKELKQQAANIIKVVLFGPESTGKTTLSGQLARLIILFGHQNLHVNTCRKNGITNVKLVRTLTFYQLQKGKWKLKTDWLKKQIRS